MTDPAERLRAERDVVVRRLAALRGDFGGMVEASRDSNADDEHDPEGQTIAFERSQLDTLIRQALARLEEVDTALARVADGSYGTCATCRRAIPEERLEARPAAATCVDCARGTRRT
ncbi:MULTISPECIES: TraR/DksA family transcriptional regulator [unclassified Nocardioides]|uniref:TraR/DksA family transcriptional regulator n=1 Tax=unclassified Nocardioides TaxID=2615069 RepID=UPI003014AF94